MAGPLLPGSEFGPYRIVERAGRGGMASVYKGYQAALARYVAIKILPDYLAEDSDFAERFKREAVAVASLRHPNIPAVFDYGELDERAYIVTEYIDGGTLAEQLGRPLPLQYASSILAQVASALDYAHARGLLHRDVKPANILLARDGRPILNDFGLAKMMGAEMQLSTAGQIMGTPLYMSPEQCSGGIVTPATDQYALAVIAYEMLTGRLPFDAATPAAVIHAQIHDPLPPPRLVNPQLPEEAEKVLLKGLAKAPEDRYPTCIAFTEALSRVPAAQAVVPEPPPAPPVYVPAPPAPAPPAPEQPQPAPAPAGWPVSNSGVMTQVRAAIAEAPPAPSRRLRLPLSALIALGAVLLLAVGGGAYGVLGMHLLGGQVAAGPTPSPPTTATPRASPARRSSPPAPAAATISLTGHWSPAGSLATARSQHTATLLEDGRVLVAGGYSGQQILASAEVFDPATNTWSSAGNMVGSRASHTATLLSDGRVLVAGGIGGGGHGVDTAELYDPRTNAWTATGRMHSVRSFLSSVRLADGRVLVAGGKVPGRPIASAETYDPGTGAWTSVAPMSTPRESFPLVLLGNGSAMAIGGTHSEGGTFADDLSSTEVYNPATGAWSDSGKMLAPRSSATADLVDGKVFVVGGGTSALESWDPAQRTWTPLQGRPSGLTMFEGGGALGGRFIAVGGNNGNTPSPAVELYGAAGTEWSTLASLPAPRWLMTVTVLKDGSVVVVGGHGPTESDPELSEVVRYK